MKTGRARYKHFKRKSKQSRTWENFAPCLVQYCGVQLCTTFVHELASKSRSQLLLYNTPSQCTWKMAMRDANFHSHHHHTWWGGFSRARMLADCPPRRSADEDWARINSAWNGKWLHTTTRCDGNQHKKMRRKRFLSIGCSFILNKGTEKFEAVRSLFVACLVDFGLSLCTHFPLTEWLWRK